jgi:non-specific serine/threonine protein kinase
MVAGEVTWRVPSLSLPGEPVPSAADAQDYDAVRLFVERAQLVRPGFALTDENIPAVVSLCRRLDGLPLAIELAAARINVLSPRQILERLQDPFQVLGEGPRSAPDRQQTLRAAMDWSYRLLGALEQRLFDRLSVFRGGCSLEAAEAIAAGDGIDAGEVLPLLAHLVERSMVVVEEAGDRSVRYRLLETIREYGRQHLAAAAAHEDLRQRHATYFLELALEADQSLRGPDQGRWLDRLELEHDNLRAALDWWADRDVDAALRLAAALGAFWLIRAYGSEGRARLSHLLLKSTPAAGTARALAMASFGSLARRQGDYAEARAHLEAALEVFRRMADRLGSARTLKELGAVAWHQGDLPLAWSLLEEAIALFRQLDDRSGMAGALNDLAVVIDLQGEDAKAEDLYKEALALYRGLGDDSGAANTLMNLGTLANELGDNAGACRYYEESAGICRRLGNREKLANVLGNFANALRDLGDLAAARQAYLESLELNRRGGDRRGVAYVLAGLGQMARDEGRYAEAMRFYREATEIRIGLGEKVELVKSIEAFAMLAFAKDDAPRGVRLAAAAAGLRRRLGAPLEPVFRTLVEERLQQARETLGSVTYDALWQEAERIGVEEALAFAMAENQE